MTDLRGLDTSIHIDVYSDKNKNTYVRIVLDSWHEKDANALARIIPYPEALCGMGNLPLRRNDLE